MEKRGRGSPVKGNTVSTGELPRRQIIPNNPRKYGTLAVSGSIGDFQLITPTHGINTVGIPPTRTCPLLFDIERSPLRSQFVFRIIDHSHKKIHGNEEMRPINSPLLCSINANILLGECVAYREHRQRKRRNRYNRKKQGDATVENFDRSAKIEVHASSAQSRNQIFRSSRLHR